MNPSTSHFHPSSMYVSFVGALRDKIVDSEVSPCLYDASYNSTRELHARAFGFCHQGVEELAAFAQAPAVFVDTAHDVMVGPKWRIAAEKVHEWLVSR